MRTLDEINTELHAEEEKQLRLLHEAEAIASRATAAGRQMTSGEEEAYLRHARGGDAAKARGATLRAEQRDALGAMAQDPRRVEGPWTGLGPDGRGSPGTIRADGPVSQLRSQAARTIDGLHRGGSLPDHAAENATGLLSAGRPQDQSLAARWVAAAGSPAYHDAFLKLMGDPDKGHLLWTPQEADAYRSVVGVQTELRAAGMTIGGGTGGYMVPLTLDPAIILSSAGTTNAMRKVSRVVQTVTNTWQGVTSAGVTAEWPGEAAQVAEATPTLAPVSIPVYLGDAYTHYSFAVGMDAVDFSAQLQKILLDAADALMATGYTTGPGTTAPTGIITALTGGASEINGTGSEAIIAADPVSLQNALPARFSPRASFMGHLAIINTLAALETTNGALRFPEIANGRLLNRPLIENSDMDGTINPAATASNFVLVYGDFNEYIIADRIGSTLEFIPNVMGANQRPTGERGALLWFRTGGNVSTIAAFRMLDVPTTA
jgi:HK97 family phage major capsid protein